MSRVTHRIKQRLLFACRTRECQNFYCGVLLSGVCAFVVKRYQFASWVVKDPVIVGLVTAGILAAIMSSLDSQFLCLGTIFTNDIVLHNTKKKYTDKQILLMARGFVLAIVVITYVLAMVLINQNVFDLAIWCFSGFAALTPLVIAALYWRRSTKEGAIASIVATTVVWFYFFAKSGFGGEYVILGGVMPVAVCWLTGVVAMVAVSLATKPPSKETVDKFFP